MSDVQVQVQVEESAFKVSQALVKLAGDVKAAIQQGQGVSEVTAIAAAIVADLLPALSLVQNLGSELKEDKFAFIKAFLLSAEDFAEAMTK